MVSRESPCERLFDWRENKEGKGGGRKVHKLRKKQQNSRIGNQVETI